VDLYIHSPIRLNGVMLNQLSTGTTLPLPYSFNISLDMAKDGGDIYEPLREESCFFSSSAHKDVYRAQFYTRTK
jgi:hypothetical protein